MDTPKSVDSGTRDVIERTESTPSVVFQPHQLKEIVEIIDLMGNVATRVREDKSGDLPATGTAGGASAGRTGASARDQAIAAAPALEIMQQKLVERLGQEVRILEKQARALARSRKRGSAHSLNEIFRKIRRLTSVIASIFEASVEVIRRFYISVFIDRQPLVVTGDSLARPEE
jgi:hypothetical protein